MTGPVPPMLARAAKGGTGKAGRAAEKALAHRLGGRQTPGSGALAGAKGDVEVRQFLIENKTSMGDSFSVKKQVLLKIYGEAMESGKVPALAFQFVTPDGKSEKRERWVCVPEHMWDEIVGDGNV